MPILLRPLFNKALQGESAPIKNKMLRLQLSGASSLKTPRSSPAAAETRESCKIWIVNTELCKCQKSPMRVGKSLRRNVTFQQVLTSQSWTFCLRLCL